MRSLVEDEWPEDAARTLAAMFTTLDRGTTADPSGDVRAVLGRDARNFEDYVVRVAATGAWTR